MIHLFKNTTGFITGCLLLVSVCPGKALSQSKNADTVTNIVFTSDAHFGITRANFRGAVDVPGATVNAALVNEINTLPRLALPQDGGVSAGKITGGIDYLIEGGDIANRMEIPIQSAAVSWDQFADIYMHKLHLTAHNGKPATLLMIPGNHDITNAIGFAKPMKPVTDPTSMVQIYNLMLKPQVPMTNEKYDYTKDKINYSFNLKGIHMMFITLWPDSAERIWMQNDLDTVASNTPVIIFTHDEPTSESKHFTNPLPPHNMTVENKFQNLLAENYKEGDIAGKDTHATDIEQRGFVLFLKAHPNIKAYFHGNTNFNQFYTYKGPDNDVALNVFRVDSPMKGESSAKDETKLSFLLISLNTANQTLTVRECLWNTKPDAPNTPIIFGQSSTISLNVK
jgi:Calcineurin-like phosphoesterase